MQEESNTTITKNGIGKCQGKGFVEGCYGIGVWRRQNTAYANDESNWNCLCEVCQADTDEYWRGMWADYYSGLL